MDIQKYTKSIRISFTFVSLSLLLAFSGIAAIANAQTETLPAEPFLTPTTTSDQLKEQAERRRAEADAKPIVNQIENAENNKPEVRAGISERTQERITNLAANMSNRMEAALSRLRNISGRLSTRITLLEEKGVNTTDATLHLEAANTSLGEAALLLADIDALVFDATSSETPREKWVGTRQTFFDSRDRIKEAHVSLKSSLASLKEAVRISEGGPGVREAVSQATSSTSTTTVSE